MLAGARALSCSSRGLESRVIRITRELELLGLLDFGGYHDGVSCYERAPAIMSSVVLSSQPRGTYEAELRV